MSMGSEAVLTAFFDRLDLTLEKFESEYHYLFNFVYNYVDDGTIVNAYIGVWLRIGSSLKSSPA